jgi:hypothetical protein
MNRSPDAWRRLVKVCGAVGLLLTVAGYVGLHESYHSYRAPALLAFYSGFAFLIAALVFWYRHVPPRPPAPEEPEHIDDSDAAEG